MTLAVPATSPTPIDRCTLERGEPDLLERARQDPHTRVLDLAGPDAPVRDEAGRSTLLLRAPEVGDAERDTYFLGRDDDGVAVLAVTSPPDTAGTHPAGTAAAQPDGTSVTRRALRDVGAALDEHDVDLYLTAVALANWHRTHPRCPRCGAATRIVDAGWVRRCEADDSQHYPRTDPAVIMAVIDQDDRLLLARNPIWPSGRRSVLAGFVEPGERLEAAVAREVEEEVGLRVRDVRYRASQPWPFPASLMLGFTARCDDTTLRASPGEIAEVEWYTREELADVVADGSLGLPGRLSIARRLIEEWYGGALTPPAEVAFHDVEPSQAPADAPASAAAGSPTAEGPADPEDP